MDAPAPPTVLKALLLCDVLAVVDIVDAELLNCERSIELMLLAWGPAELRGGGTAPPIALEELTTMGLDACCGHDITVTPCECPSSDATDMLCG